MCVWWGHGGSGGGSFTCSSAEFLSLGEEPMIVAEYRRGSKGLFRSGGRQVFWFTKVYSCMLQPPGGCGWSS